MADERTKNSGHALVLVPGKSTVNTEKEISALKCSGRIDALDFKRLADYVMRRVGGLTGDYVTRGAKKVIMNTVVSDVSGELLEYKNVSENDLRMTDTFVATRTAMMKDGITPEMLSEAGDRLSGRNSAKTKNKLHDLGIIFNKYDEVISGQWKDPDGLTAALIKALGDGKFFDDYFVYIDGFRSFTKQEYQIVEKIFKHAPYVCVTMAFNKETDSAPIFDTVRNTDRYLHEMAARYYTEVKELTPLTVQKRQTSSELKYLAANYWNTGNRNPMYAPDGGKISKNVQVISARNIFAESEAVVCDIMKRVHNGGARWRDFGIAVRDISLYSGVINAVLEQYSVPYYISAKTDIGSISLIRLIICALDMKVRGLYGDTLLSYIKTGLCGITPDECFEFENYIQKWRISGKRLLDDFTENPSGFSGHFTDDEKELLIRLNETRKKIIGPLAKLFGVLESRQNAKVSDRATALYDYLVELDIENKLKKAAGQAHRNGDFSGEMVMGQVWRLFCDALDSLVISSGERVCTVPEFKTYLQAVLSETGIGSIPMSLDQVLVFEASDESTFEFRTLYMMGCSEGSFPASVGESGLFTEQEKSELAKIGVEISSRLENRLEDELYYFYRMTAMPSENLIMSYSFSAQEGGKAEQSSGVNQVIKTIGNVNISDYDTYHDYDRIWDEESAFEYCLSHDNELSDLLRDRFESGVYGDYTERLQLSETPITEEECRMDPEAASELFDDNMKMSSSRLEKYAKCHFSYFCDYELRLEERKPQDFEATDIGTFVHKLLEDAVQYVADKEDATDEDIDRIVTETSEKYLNTLMTGELPNRVKHVTDFLCRGARNFVKEIRDDMKCSKFKPADFEYQIGGKGQNALEITDGKTTVMINGKIDRVDTYTDDEGKVHVFISDYKTGKKEFSMTHVDAGIDLQMLLYLFSISENGKDRYGNDIIPSGISYVMVKSKSEDSTSTEDDGGKIKTSGLVTADEKWLTEDTMNKDCITYNGTAEELEEKVRGVVLGNAKQLKSGFAEAEPNPVLKNNKPCRYCVHRYVCRAAK